MAASNYSRSGGRSKTWREQSPDRNVVWSEPQNVKLKRVPVLYYLSKNGQLQHPHFMEVPLSSPRGLFLKDVINRLSALRGKAMPSMYSWSSKRSYKNGFVWQDLSENDLIYPAHAHEYILKGSELPENAFPEPPPERQTDTATGGDQERATPRRNRSCSSIDFEYNIYKPDQCSSKSAATDVSTQTDGNRRRRCTQPSDVTEQDDDDKELYQAVVIEVSTSPSDSSPETLGTLMKAGGQVRAATAAASGSHRHQNNIQRCKSSVLMHLISCGSMPFKDCGASGGQRLIGQQKMRAAPRGGGTAESGRVKLEEKEYFSGSFVETKKREIPAIKRSNSYNADRSLNLEVAEKEIERLKAKCIPTKIKAHSSNRKQGHYDY